MSTAASNVTAKQLAALPIMVSVMNSCVGLKTMSLAGGIHGRIAMRIACLLASHVEQYQLGEVFAAATGFLLSTDLDTVRAPDAAFVRAEVIAQLENLGGYLPIAPDLVIEVVSPNDSSIDVEAKAQMWIEYGVRLVMVVDPTTTRIRIYRTRSKIAVHFMGEEVDASHAVANWQFAIADVF